MTTFEVEADDQTKQCELITHRFLYIDCFDPDQNKSNGINILIEIPIPVYRVYRSINRKYYRHCRTSHKVKPLIVIVFPSVGSVRRFSAIFLSDVISFVFQTYARVILKNCFVEQPTFFPSLLPMMSLKVGLREIGRFSAVKHKVGHVHIITLTSITYGFNWKLVRPITYTLFKFQI